MSMFSVIPSKTFIVSKGVQNVKIVKNYTLDVLKWNKVGDRYLYTITGEVSEDSIVFINTLPEYQEKVDTYGILLSCPEISSNRINIYAKSLPAANIVVNYAICKEIDAVATDKASNLPYVDTHGIGVSDVQSAIDKLIEMINNK